MSAYARRAIAERQRQNQIKSLLSSKWKRIKDPLKTGGWLYPLFDAMKTLAFIATAM